MLTCCDRPHREWKKEEKKAGGRTLLISDHGSDSWPPQEDTAWGFSSFDPLRVLSGMHKHTTVAPAQVNMVIFFKFNSHNLEFLSCIYALTYMPTQAYWTLLAQECRLWHESLRNTQPELFCNQIISPSCNSYLSTEGELSTSVGWVCGVCLLGHKSYILAHTNIYHAVEKSQLCEHGLHIHTQLVHSFSSMRSIGALSWAAAWHASFSFLLGSSFFFLFTFLPFYKEAI